MERSIFFKKKLKKPEVKEVKNLFPFIRMKVYILIVSLFLLTGATAWAQQPLTLTLERTIEIANDSSLSAFLNQNRYLSSYWEFRTYKANRLPSLTLNITPAEYYKNISRQWDSEDEQYRYYNFEYYSANGGLSINQNFDPLGGTFYIDSRLDYLRNLGGINTNQFTSVPIRIGYYQDLLGYNPFKWEKKLEPLKYEKAKKQLIYNMEEVSETATNYFFSLAMAQVSYDMAKDILASSDTLYAVGLERHKIAAIAQNELLTLKLDAINARNTVQTEEIELKRAMFALASFLNFDKNTEIRLRLPSRPRNINISADEALILARENNPTFLEQRQNIIEAEQQVDKTKKESQFNASFSASVGFNQEASKLKNAYRDLLQQDIVSISFSIPLIDWGVRKGKYNMAKNNLNVIQISARQTELSVEEDVIMTVGDFNIQLDLIHSAEEALDLSIQAYEETKQRFMIGKADINSLTLSLQRQQTAQSNYISALRNYWLSYFKIRKLTLHDFETGISLSNLFDYKTAFE